MFQQHRGSFHPNQRGFPGPRPPNFGSGPPRHHGPPPHIRPPPGIGFEEFGPGGPMPPRFSGPGRGVDFPGRGMPPYRLRGGRFHGNRGGFRGRGGNFRGGSHPKKIKVDKRDLPENNKFYCDACDRGFKTDDKFKEHVDGHQKCHYDGCSYIAAPKLVKLHIDLQHRTGMAKKIWSLESEEDIKKWKEERRKNFPTASNIAKKQAELQERRERGEVLETKQFGRMNRRGRGRGRGGHDRRHGHKRQWRQTPSQFQNDGIQAEDEKGAKHIRLEEPTSKREEVKVRDPTIDPLAYVLEDASDSDSPPTEVPLHTGKTALPSTSLAGGLGSLAASYGDVSDSEEEEKKEDIKSDKKPSAIKNNGATNKGHPNHLRPRRKRKREAFELPKKATLLEKLLANEIRHERNVILQCVRYVVRNNFFKERSSEKSSSETDKISDIVNTPNLYNDDVWE
ncbi:nuclear fragile X mental retardation-interacting protein 1 [Lingula anatina]|uniref:Nuclear fragile X mental retardation-interacting protein 1 n=1 Tax=Lingula anatina TaxID=7574 RepID=A0A1S3IUQ0_LINAN|nr:nuclear fragile X mental retardation-interacting protein 1 [Lingula anatina]|eukprot:XP_013401264.1 nuclear fragile X mental retardation-interacting protein 1 [Lingula anatina]